MGGNEVARLLGVSDATVSRVKTEQVESFSRFLSALGLKVVPAEHKCYPVEYIDHLRYFARIGMAQEQPPVLEWEDDK